MESTIKKSTQLHNNSYRKVEHFSKVSFLLLFSSFCSNLEPPRLYQSYIYINNWSERLTLSTVVFCARFNLLFCLWPEVSTVPGLLLVHVMSELLLLKLRHLDHSSLIGQPEFPNCSSFSWFSGAQGETYTIQDSKLSKIKSLSSKAVRGS